MIVQNVGTSGTANISFTVAEEDLNDALKVASAATDQLGGTVEHAENLSKVSVVGHGMQTHTGVAAQMFQELANEGVNIHVVTTSEIKISVLIDRDLCDSAANAVHAGFKLHEKACAIPAVGVATERTKAAIETRDVSKLEQDIVSRLTSMEDIVVSDVYSDSGQARVTITGVNDRPGVAATLFSAVADGGIMVDMIIQNAAHDGAANISFTVPAGDVNRTVDLLKDKLTDVPDAEISSDANIGILSVVGIGLRSHTDVGAKLFRALSEHSINVQMVNTSEIKVSVVVSESESETALKALRATFGVA